MIPLTAEDEQHDLKIPAVEVHGRGARNSALSLLQVCSNSSNCRPLSL